MPLHLLMIILSTASVERKKCQDLCQRTSGSFPFFHALGIVDVVGYGRDHNKKMRRSKQPLNMYKNVMPKNMYMKMVAVY